MSLKEAFTDYIWNICFITIVTLIILLFTNKSKQNKKIVSFIMLIGAIAFVLPAFFKIKNYISTLSKINYIYEIFCWLIILINLVKSNILNRKITVNINKTEKILLSISIFIGLFCLLKMYSFNPKYIFPLENNFYFNADVSRCVIQISFAQEIIHKIHPLYRFITLPLMLPVYILNIFLQGNLSNQSVLIINGYIACTLQIIFNSISSIMLYRILKEEKLNNKMCIIGVCIFLFSISTIWMSILPETYAVTVFMLLTFIHLYQKRKKSCIVAGIIAIGLNIMSAVPIGLITIIEVVKRFSLIKQYVKIYHVIILGVILYFLIPYLGAYVINWICLPNNIVETLTVSLNYFLIPLLYGPKFMQNVIYFVQSSSFEYIALVFFAIFFILAAIRIYKE